MKLHLDSPATSPRHKLVSRSMPVRLGALALAVLFTATQMPAQGAPATTPQTTVQQNAAGSQNSAQAPATNTTVSTSPALNSSDSTKIAMSALPEAPVAQSETSESASVNISPEMKAMMDDASKSLEPTATPAKKKLVQRPGMLVMGIAGVPLIVLGTMIMGLKVGSKAAGTRNALGAAFLAPGAAMSGIGFYFAFHKKSN